MNCPTQWLTVIGRGKLWLLGEVREPSHDNFVIILGIREEGGES